MYSVLTETLKHALQLPVRIAHGMRGPMYNQVLMKVSPGGVTFTATDMETSVVTQAAAKVEIEHEERIVLDGSLLLELISNAPDYRVDVERQPGVLVVTIGGAKTKLKFSEMSEYPDIQANAEATVTFRASLLHKAISAVLDPVDVNSSRPALTGVGMMFRIMEDNPAILQVTGASPYRFHQDCIPVESQNPDLVYVNTIAPKSTLRYLLSLLKPHEDQSVSVSVKDDTIHFSSDNWTLIGQIIDGNYPNVEHLIPTAPQFQITAYLEELRQAIRFASIMSSMRCVYMDVAPNCLTIHAESIEVGKAAWRIDCTSNIDEQGARLAIDYKYLQQALDETASEQVTISFDRPANPAEPVKNVVRIEPVISQPTFLACVALMDRSS